MKKFWALAVALVLTLQANALPTNVGFWTPQSVNKPSFNVDFTRGYPSDIITFTRSSSATYFTGLGVTPTTVGTNFLRSDINPVDGSQRGFLSEIARTNLLLNSQTLGTQTVTVTAVAHTLSFYGTGTVTLSGAAIAVVAGSGAFPTRTEYTFTPSAGSLVLTVTGTVQYANLEAVGSATSWIPTTGTTATRAIDYATVTDLTKIRFNPNEGTIYVEIEPKSSLGNEMAFAFQNGVATTNAIFFLREAGGGNAFINTTSGSGGRITGIGTFANARKVAIAYKNKNSCLSINGVNYTNSTFNMPIGIDRLAIGNQAGSATRSLNGWIKVVKYWPKRLTNDQLLMLTR